MLFTGPIVYVELDKGWLFDGAVGYVQPNDRSIPQILCSEENRVARFPSSTRREVGSRTTRTQSPTPNSGQPSET